MATLTAFFPNEPDAKYDFTYYVNHHLPMVQKTFAKYGVKNWTARKVQPGPDGSEPKYAFGAVGYWESAEGIREAFAGPEAAGLIEDVANFSNKQPVFIVSEPVTV